MTYKDAGVDITLGDLASDILYKASRETWKNREGRFGEVFIPFEHFSGLRAVRVGGLPADSVSSLSFDGIGTKVEVAERDRKHNTAAYDLFAMLCDDAVRYGVEPVLIGSVLDVKSLGKDANGNYLHYIQQIADGMVDAAREANVAVINGEIAELGYRVRGYGEFNYNWAGGVVWFGRESRLLTGFEVEPGNSLVALKEEGFRSNGISLLRKIMVLEYGDEWQEEKYKGEKLGEIALHPSKIYSATVVDMTGGFEGEPKADVRAVAHITGGGIPGKLGRTLKPSGLGALIDDPFEPCDLMLHCQEIGDVADEEAYNTWNMGQGKIITTPEPDNVIKIAKSHNIEAKVVGRIKKEPGIEIISRGYHKDGELLLFR